MACVGGVSLDGRLAVWRDRSRAYAGREELREDRVTTRRVVSLSNVPRPQDIGRRSDRWQQGIVRTRLRRSWKKTLESKEDGERAGEA